MMGSAAAKKAWHTRRKGRGHSRHYLTDVESAEARKAELHGVEYVFPAAKHRGRKKKRGKGMPENVKEYFRNITKGMSKAEARKAAGMPPKSKGRKKWGPGHPLYDWKQKHGR